MARIRTIKPEFWTDEQIMELSPHARLCFVGMWSFCDDSGVHPASAKTLKAEIFPCDDVSASDVLGMVSEMIAQGLVEWYEVEGKAYWIVLGWHHQKIDQPTYKYPLPDGTFPGNQPKRRINQSKCVRRTLDERSADTSRTLDERSASVHPRKGREEEGKGKEVKTPPPLPPSRMTLAQARKRYRDHMGAELGGGVNQTLTVLCQTHTAEAIELALEATSTRLPRPTNPFSYFQAVLSGQSLERASPDEFDPSKDYPAGSFFAAMKAEYEAKHGN